MGINVAPDWPGKMRNCKRQLQRLTVELQGALRVMDEMTLPETAELLEVLQDRGHE